MAGQHRRPKGLGSIMQRGTHYRIRINYCRERIAIPNKATSKQEAEQILRQYLGEMDKGLSPDSAKIKFGDLAMELVTDYEMRHRRSIKTLISRLNLHILPYFGCMKVFQITGRDIADYTEARINEGAAYGSINRELNHINKSFKLGMLHDITHRKPGGELLPEPRYRRGRNWTDPEFAKVLEHLPEDIQAPVRFMYITGWRVSEVQSLGQHNIDWQEREVRLDPGSTKTDQGHRRVFPFIPGLEELLVEQLEKTSRLEAESGKAIPWVFHRKGKQIRSFTADWYKAIKEAGITGLRRHDYRGTALDNLLKRGFSPLEILTMIGWSSLRMLEYYFKIDTRELHKKADQLRESAKKKAEFLRDKVQNKVQSGPEDGHGQP